MAYKILAVILAVLTYLFVVSQFTNTMAGVLVIIGSLAFMWAVADFFMWLFEKGNN